MTEKVHVFTLVSAVLRLRLMGSKVLSVRPGQWAYRSGHTRIEYMAGQSSCPAAVHVHSLYLVCGARLTRINCMCKTGLPCMILLKFQEIDN